MLMMMLESLVYVAPKANAVVDAQCALGCICSQLQIMRNHHNGYILLSINAPQHIVKANFRSRIDTSSGLVQKQNLRSVHHGAC